MLHWKLLLARLQAMHVYIHFCTHFYYACLPTCPVQTRLCYRSLEIHTTSMYMHMSKHVPADKSFAHLYAHPSCKCVHTRMCTGGIWGPCSFCAQMHWVFGMQHASCCVRCCGWHARVNVMAHHVSSAYTPVSTVPAS